MDSPRELVNAADEVLLPGLRHMWRTIGRIQELGRPEAAEWRFSRGEAGPSDALLERLLHELYALSRIGDVLVAPFQEPSDLARSDVWDGPLPEPDVWDVPLPEPTAYGRFCEALEMTRVDERRFHPFFHEIVAVEIADGLDAEIELVDEVWPGYMLGCLLFMRAGVRVRACATSLSPAAAQSPLWFSWWRRNRFTVDASHTESWNDKWMTHFRRDYSLTDRLIYNVDAREEPDSPPPPFVRPGDFPSREERLEYLRFRHRLRESEDPHPHPEDFWMFNCTWSEARSHSPPADGPSGAQGPAASPRDLPRWLEVWLYGVTSLEEALETASALPVDDERDNAYCALAETLRRAGRLDAALATLRRVDDGKTRDEEFLHIMSELTEPSPMPFEHRAAIDPEMLGTPHVLSTNRYCK